MRFRGSGKYGTNANANDISTWKQQDLLHIGDDGYYLQTENYNSANKKGFKLDLTNGTLTSYDKLTIQGGTPGADNGVLISTENQSIDSLAGQSGKTDWRLALGSHFGVDAKGNLYANSGTIGG